MKCANFPGRRAQRRQDALLRTDKSSETYKNTEAKLDPRAAGIQTKKNRGSREKQKLADNS